MAAVWVIGMPLLDTLSIIVRRLAQGRSPLAPDRDHLHYVLLRAGLSVGQTVSMLMLVGLLFGAIGIGAWRFGVADSVLFYGALSVYAVYLAVMPAEVIRGPLAPDDAAASPYRSAEARDTHHVMVSIFETRDRRRVTDARVMARVAALGFSGEKKALEPTAVAGAAVYGGFFPMMGRGPYRVDIEFRAPPRAQRQHASFYFTHPGFKAPMRGEQNGSPRNE